MTIASQARGLCRLANVATVTFRRAFRSPKISRNTESNVFPAAAGPLATMSSATQKSYFELLGLKDENFLIDDEELANRLRERQRQWHPDRFHDNVEARKDAELTSADLNVAYDTLSKPHLRAGYFLERAGIPLTENESAGSIDEPEFLDYVMSVRETLEEEPDKEVLAKLFEENHQLQQECVKAAAEAFDKLRQDERHQEAARRAASKLQYIHRIAEEIHQQTEV